MVEEIDKILRDPNRLKTLAREAFNSVDTDKRGEIDESELKTVMTQMSKSMGTPPPQERQLQMLYKQLDSEGSGVVNFDQFLVLIRQSLEAVKARKLGESVPEEPVDNSAQIAEQKRKEEERRRQREAQQEEAQLDKQVAAFDNYIEASGLNQAFQLIFAEIMQQQVPMNEIFSYTAMRLRQIGQENADFLPAMFKGSPPE